MNLRSVRLLALGCFVCLIAATAECAPNSGKISGVVVDAGGTPQMGATVVISTEKLLASSSPLKLQTNGHGNFATDALPAGMYTVEVTLAGFLPSIEQHIEVSGTHTTLLQVVMGSMISSLGQLRQKPEKQGAADDWVWVLRSTEAARAVLRWDDSPDAELAAIGEDGQQHNQDRTFVQLSSGGENPTSVSSSIVAPGTEFAYDVPTGPMSRFLVAGQFSYLNDASATGLAAEWLPTGDERTGPVTTLVVRQSNFGPGGPVFRGIRASHEEQMALGSQVTVRYGGEFVYAGFGSGTMAMRPRAEVAYEMSPEWQLSVIIATHPWQDGLGDNTGALESAVNSFDAFPTLMMRHGQAVFENGLHEEAGVKHSMGDGAELTAALFHDRSTHTAVMGIGSGPRREFVQGFFGDAFAYDGGETNSTGGRVVYDQKIAPGLASTVIYDYSGALALEDPASGPHLRDQLATRYRHGVATRVSARIPGINTRLVVGYKWLSGSTVSQQDPYGEAMYGIDPYLSMGLRQPLPSFVPGHVVVQADMGNLLSQGSTSTNANGQDIVLVPSYRYFRGGLSFQF